MDPQPRHQLAALIQKEGVGLADDPQRIKAHLLDACPESRTEVELLVAGAVDGLASRLARSSDTVFRDGEIARAVADLRRTRRLDQEAAEWVVRSWAWALGVVDEEPADERDGAPDKAGGPMEVSSPGPAPAAAPSAPPHFAPPSPRPEPPYETTGPTSAPQYQQAGSAPPYGQPGSAPPYGQVGAPPMGTPSAPPWTGEASAPHPQPPSSPPSHETTQPVWGTGPQQPGPYAQQWAGAPSGSGALASGAGGSPPTGPSAPPYTPPPKRNRGLLIGLVAAVLAVVAVVVGLVAVDRSAPPTETTADPPVTPPTTTAPSSPGSTAPATVNFQVWNYLDPSVEYGDRVTMYSQGREVGTLEVSPEATSDVLYLTAPAGPVDYELEMYMIFTDGTDASFGGEGTLDAYEGARYYVTATPSGSGYEVTLRAET